MSARLPASEVDLLQECPWCDYRLTGLPPEHRCPECGRPIDRRSRVFWAISPAWWRLWAVGSVALVLLLVLYVVAMIASGANYSVAILTVLILVAIRHMARNRAFVAVSPTEVCIGNRRKGEESRYPLEQIQRAECDRRFQLILHLTRGSIRVSGFGRAISDALPCARYINRMHEQLAEQSKSDRLLKPGLAPGGSGNDAGRSS